MMAVEKIRWVYFDWMVQDCLKFDCLSDSLPKGQELMKEYLRLMEHPFDYYSLCLVDYLIDNFLAEKRQEVNLIILLDHITDQ